MYCFLGGHAQGCSWVRIILHNVSINRIHTSTFFWFVTANSITFSCLGGHCYEFHRPFTCISRAKCYLGRGWLIFQTSSLWDITYTFLSLQGSRTIHPNYFKPRGYSKSIISDRDPIFISKSLQTLLQLNGTKIRMSTAYHPQTDKETEILDCCLQQYLYSFVHAKPSKTRSNFCI